MKEYANTLNSTGLKRTVKVHKVICKTISKPSSEAFK